jgi:hypothetical protein
MKHLFLLIIFIDIAYLAKTQTLFIWPVKPMPAYSEVADFYVTNNFIDNNTTTAIQDWNCGTRTYNGHLGIDIDLWPFTWSMMDNNYVAAIAAAPGRVAAVTDNLNNENNCGQTGENTAWNYIAIRHADSSTSIYGHIRTNSAQVTVGQIVSAGDVLAYVGSSGNSSNPHLHFEVNSLPVNNSAITGLIDPYTGPCNTLNTNSWWQTQKPYREPAIVRVMTHGSRPSLPGYDNNPFPGFCRTAEVKNAKASFLPNDSIYVGIGMRDFLQNQIFVLTVYNPDGSTWFSEANSNNSADYTRRYYTFAKKISSTAAAGTYKVVVNFNATTAVHFFSVNCPTTQNVPGLLSGYLGFKASSQITSNANLSASGRLLLQAGDKITLSTGFKASQGSVMKARIRDCNYSE